MNTFAHSTDVWHACLRLRQVVREAAAHNLLVMLCIHRMTKAAWPGAGLWYGSGITESDALRCLLPRLLLHVEPITQITHCTRHTSTKQNGRMLPDHSTEPNPRLDSLGPAHCRSWHTLSSLFCSEWNVFAADIQNEPFSASWGRGFSTDWNVAASRIGDYVLSQCGRWLIMVQGVGHTPGAVGDEGPEGGYWWGERA